MDRDGLKSCPFCGSAAKLVEDRWGVKARCPSCTASIYMQKIYGKDAEHNEKETVIRYWNRRTYKFE